MFSLSKEFTFEASHVLPHHDGKCARLHGHSWKLRVMFRGERLHAKGPQRGMLVDFGRIKAIVQPFVDAFLDHHHLNESLKLESPTSEAVAALCYSAIAEAMSVSDPEMLALFAGVGIDETCTSACVYAPGGPLVMKGEGE